MHSCCVYEYERLCTHMFLCLCLCMHTLGDVLYVVMLRSVHKQLVCMCAFCMLSVGICVSVFMHTHLNSRHARVCLCMDLSLPLQTPKVAKIQVAWPIKGPLEVPLTPGTRVAHVLRQFTEHLSASSQGQEGNEDTDSLLPR